MIKDESKDYDYDYAQYRGWYDKFRATQPPTTNQVVLMKELMVRCKNEGIDVKRSLRNVGMKKLKTNAEYGKAINMLYGKLYEVNALMDYERRDYERKKRFHKRDMGPSVAKASYTDWLNNYGTGEREASTWSKMHESGELVYLGDRTVKKTVLQREN